MNGNHQPCCLGSSESFVDINLVPLGSVERIEVLTDGASAFVDNLFDREPPADPFFEG